MDAFHPTAPAGKRPTALLSVVLAVLWLPAVSADAATTVAYLYDAPAAGAPSRCDAERSLGWGWRSRHGGEGQDDHPWTA